MESKPCKFGPSCRFLAAGTCAFKHDKNSNFQSKTIEEIYAEIKKIKTKSADCTYDEDCSNYLCYHSHSTKSKLSPNAEKKIA